MKQKKPYKKGHNFTAKARSREEMAPKIRATLEKGMDAVRELDPLIRDTFRDDPAALAEWEEIMREFRDLREED